MKINIHCFIFTFIFFQNIFSQNNPILSTLDFSPISTAVPFVGMSSDAKNAAFGNCGISAISNVNSTFWNIAKTSEITEKFSSSFNYSPLLVNLQLDNYALMSISNIYKIKNEYAISLFGKYLNIGKYDITDATGQVTNSAKPIQFTIGAGFAMSLNRNYSIGLGAKYIYTNLAWGGIQNTTLVAGNAIALDISLNYNKKIDFDKLINWGFSITNLGNKISYNNNGSNADFLPANIGIGVGFTKLYEDIHSFHFGFDLNKLLVPVRPNTDTIAMKSFYNQSVFLSWFNSFYDAKGGFIEELKEIYLNFGVDYTYKEWLHGKLGYVYQNPLKGNASMITIGTSISYLMFDIDLAYGMPVYSSNNANTSPLANSIRFGLVYKFDEN